MAWICDKNGNRKCEIKRLSYNGTFMEVSSITVTVESPTPIDFAIGDYIDWDYDGLRYSLDTAAGVEKQARRNTIGKAFVYENLVFLSPLQAANNVDFLDVVIGNTVDFMTNTEFSFYGTAWDYAKRLEANLCRLYGEGAWKVRIWTNGVCYDTAPAVSIDTGAWENKLIEVSKIKCLGGFQQIYDLWGCAYVFSVESGVNYVDFYDDFEQYAKAWKQGGVDKIFAYGKGNGLYKIRHTPDADHLLVTRLRAYGSAENLPANYYLNSPLYHVDGNESSELAIANLMLPASEWTKDGVKAPMNAYLEQNTDLYGVREASVAWDGSDEELGEIKPSIYGLTIQDLLDLMSPGDGYRPIVAKWPDTSQRIDKIITGAAPADNGAVAESGYDFTVVEAQGVFSANELSAARVYNIVDFGDLTMATIPSVEHLADYRVVPTSENVKVASFDVQASVIDLITDVNAYITPYVNGVKVDDATIPCMVSSEVISREVSGVEYTKRYYIHLLDANSAAVVFSTMRTGAVTFKIQANITYSGQANQVTVLRNEYAVNFNLLRGNKAIDKFFSVIIPQIGFDLSAAMTGSAKLCMRSGYNQPREFPIVASSVRYDSATDTWYLRCKRVVDQSTKTYFPNSDAIIATGDEYYFSGIAMPALYVEIAARKLLAAARAWLELHSKPRMLSSVDVDNKIMAVEGIVLREGMSLPIDDDDLSISPETQESRIIDNIRIEEGDNSTRTFSITLRDKKEGSSIDSAIRGATSGLATSASVSEAVSAAESKDHGALSGRDMPNQHPISAITGLEDALAALTFFEEDGNGNVKLKDAYGGLWANGFGSFGGVNSGGGGGGADLLSVWVSLKNNDDDYANWLINAHHIPIGNGLTIDSETGLINVSAMGTVTSVAGVYPVGGDVQLPGLMAALGITNLDNNLATISDCLKSLQSQVDSVASRDMFDELSATSLYADVAVAQSLYADSISLEGNDLSAKLNTLVPKTTTVNGHALSGNISLTKSDVGLGNVENTALSTWAGTGNITTLGTITTGVWHGTPIANDYLANKTIGVGGATITLGSSATLTQIGIPAWAQKASLAFADMPAMYIGNARVQSSAQTAQNIGGLGTITASGLIKTTNYLQGTRLILADGVYLEYDSSSQGVKLVGAGFWTESYVTAGGVGSHSGGGGGGVVEQLYRFSDLGGSFDDATNDAFNAYTVNALYLRIVALESRPTGGVTSVAGMVGDVTTASLASALGITNLNNNLSTISECIQSLQSQIDAVATRDRFDELTATAAFADVLSASAIHVESLSLDGSDLAGSLSALGSRATSLEGRATALEGRASTLEGKFTGDSANSALRLTTVSKTAWGQTYWTSGGVPDSISGNMSSVGSISMNGSISGVTSITASGLIKTTNYVQATRFYLTDSIYFVADSNGVKLEGAGFYTDSFVTAGGVGSGGGGGDVDLPRVWESLTNNTDFPNTEINPAHIPDMAATYGYLKSITSAMVVSALGYTPFSSANFTKANIQSTLGISDWALASTKPGYSVSEISGLQDALGTKQDAISDLGTIRSNAAHGETAHNSLSTVSEVLQSLQSQIDSVASRDCFDELTASVFHSDMVAVSDLYAESISLNGADLATSLSGLSTAIANEATARANAIAAEVTARNTAIANAVNALDSATEAVSSGYFLTGVTITDGKITGRAQANSISGNAATATRLADNNAHYLWGVSYWVSGVPQDVTAAPNLYIARTKVSASAANDTLLGVTAISNASSSGTTGDETRIEWDATNHAWHFYGGIYADTFVVAGGIGSSGGGSDIDLPRVWKSLTNNTDFPDVEINLAHIPDIPWENILSKPTTLAGYGITDAIFGTQGADYVPITLGATTKNVLTAHQSLSAYATKDYVGQQGFITKAVNDLTNYYTKTQTYTRAEVNDLIGSINQFHYEIAASTGAVTDPQSNVLYLIGPTGSGSDKYEEYVYTTQWVKIGDTSIDLTPYLTKTLAAQTYQPIISDLESIISNAAHGEAAYNSLTTVSAILQSLQSQVDSVASRDSFDELTAKVFYSDVAAVSDLYVGAVSLNGVDLAGSLSSLASRATSLESRATALEGRAASLESRASTLESYFTNGVANSALRLSGTATYSIWGVEYWSSGVPKSVTGRPGLYIGTTQVQTSAASQDLNGIAAINASGLATIAGGIKLTTTKKIYFGDTDHYLELDSNGFHFSHGVYSEDFVTAGGIGSGGGGDSIDIDRLWQSLQNNPADQGYEDALIAPAHIPDMAATYGYLKGNQTIALTGVVTGSGTTSIATSIADGALSIAKVSGLQAALDSKTGNTGTVTSVGLSVPTGLSVSGSPITTSGTLAITFASGYSIPTTAQQSAWSGKQDAISDLATIRSNASNGATAYSWGNHANAGYLLASVAAETYATLTALDGKQATISDLATIRSNAASGATAYSWGNHANAGYLTSANGTTISQALQSLQSQIDSVASRDMFDELTATVLHSDIVTASNAYFDAITAASANIASITGSLSGNATTASYLVSASYGIGGGLNPIYFSSGRPVASTSTAGSASVPVYLNGGTLTAITPSSLFSALSSSAATNLSVTIAGQGRTITDLYARYDKDGGEIAPNMTTIGTALRSLQSQVDSVASRDMFDELNATVLFTDILSVGGDTHIGGKIWFDSTHYIEIINGYLHTNLPIVSDSYITAGA